jgi:hypothetical protein
MELMDTQSHAGLTPESARVAMPGAVRWIVLATLGLLLAGALYLVAVRGEALLLDLAKIGRIFCL